MRPTLAILVLWMGLLLCPARAAANPQPPFSHDGRWITDAAGRVVILHGVAVVIGGFASPATPELDGFTAADARFLAAHGLQLVRLGIFDQYLEPAPGAFDDAYLDSIARTQALLADAGIVTVLDLHQDLLAGRYQGRGFADWFPVDDGLPNPPQPGFPGGYLVNPALNRAYDNLWANVPTSDGLGAIDHIAALWRRVAQRFAGARLLLGYDLFNEPWPGTLFATCASTLGCPPGGFDQTRLTAFFDRVVAAVRQVDSVRLAFAEPNLQFDFGAATGLGTLADSRVGLSFHDYCLNYVVPSRPDPANVCGQTGETFVFQNADTYSQRSGATLLLTEFGDTPDPSIHARVAGLADRFMVGWTDWAYVGSSGKIKKVDAQPPAPDNIDAERLASVVRPYPQLVAGTPQRYGFAEATKQFELVYSTRLPGGRAAGTLRSEVFVPRLEYAGGYRVQVSGAEVVAGLSTQRLVLRNCTGRTTVTLTITAASARGVPSCTAQAAARQEAASRAGGGSGTRRAASRAGTSGPGQGVAGSDAGGSGLPFTGLAVGAIALAGLGLFGGGLALRRLS